jgi:hypothetical protein
MAPLLTDNPVARRHILADGRDRRRDRFFDGHAARFRRLDFFDIGACGQRDIRDQLHQALEMVVARDEVGFRIDLDRDALGAGHLDADQAFGRDTAGLLRCFRKAFLAQPIDRGFHVALGLVERGLAIHHARAGLFAQFLDHRSGDFSHCRTIRLPSEIRERGAFFGSALTRVIPLPR